MAEHRPCYREDAGSIPAAGSIPSTGHSRPFLLDRIIKGREWPCQATEASNLSTGKTARMIREKLEKLEAERADLQTALRIVEGLEADDGGVVTTVTGGATPADGVGATADPDEHWVYPGMDIDFAGTSNLLERLVRIAEAVRRTVWTPWRWPAALSSAGPPRPAPHNLRSHITNALKDDPDFVKTGPGQYRYVPAGGVTLPSNGSINSPS